MTTLHLCLITDDNYVMPTSVAIQSCIENKQPDTIYHFHIVASDLSKEVEESFLAFSREDILVDVIKENAAEKFRGLHVFDENAMCAASISALLKFILPELLPDLDRVLYLDGDLIVNAALNDLYQTDIKGVYAAAVIDSGSIYFKHDFVTQVEHYFNSGVMVFNLDKMREDNMTEKLIQQKRDLNDSSLMDQNVFNLVFDGHVKFMPIYYNFMPVNLERSNNKWTVEDINEYYQTTFERKTEVFSAAKIIHYSSKDKPWKNPDGAMADIWMRYYEKLMDEEQEKPTAVVSVIIPCYNAAAFIEETLESVFKQDYPYFEVICLDDGSTDNTLQILQNVQKLHDNMIVRAEENHRQGYERNLGVTLAKGKYIYYMDADDLLEENCFSRIVTCAEENKLDLLFFEATSFFEEESLREEFRQYETLYLRKNAYPEIYEGERLYAKFRKQGDLIISPCLQIARKDFLLENEISFPELPVMEDNLYTIKSILKAKRVKCISDILYRRRVRRNSTMTGIASSERAQAIAYTIRKLFDWLDEYEPEGDTYNAILNNIFAYIRLYAKDDFVVSNPNMDEVLKDIEKIHIHRILPILVGMDAKVMETMEERIELRDRLKQTYAEKSEINRKLQITYQEKAERGITIKELREKLKKQEETLKKCQKELKKEKNKKTTWQKIVGKIKRTLKKIVKR